MYNKIKEWHWSMYKRTHLQYKNSGNPKKKKFKSEAPKMMMGKEEGEKKRYLEQEFQSDLKFLITTFPLQRKFICRI